MPKRIGSELETLQISGKEESGQRQYARLEVAGRFKDIAAQVFDSGMFDRKTQALLEFTDNAVGARDRMGGGTRILVAVSNNRLRIAAFDEAGMGDVAIQRLFRAGETGSLDQGIGTKGVGAKFAIFALARDLKELVAKLPGSKTQWKVSAPGLGDEKIDYAGTLAIDPEPARETDVPIGIVDIALEGMKWDEPPSAVQLARNLGTTYAPILVSAEGKWTHQTVSPQNLTRPALQPDGTIRQTTDRLQIFVSSNKNTIQALPPEYKAHPGIQPIDKVVTTSKNEPLHLRAMVLDLGNLPMATKAREKPAGGHLYFDGRLVERGVFPETPEMRDTGIRSRLRFQVDVTHIADIKEALQMNKSAGIRPGSQRQRILDAVTPELMPLVEAIKAIEVPHSSQMTSRFRDRLNVARQIADAALKTILDDGEISLNAATVQGVLGNMRKAQESPTNSGEPKEKSAPLGVKGKPWNDQSPRTVPARTANPDIPRRRLTPYTPRVVNLAEKETSRVTIEAQKAYLDINSAHRLTQFYEMLDSLDPSAGDIAAVILGATEQMRHLARELSNGDQDKEFAIEQAGLWAVAEILAKEPSWQQLDARAKELAKERIARKKK